MTSRSDPIYPLTGRRVWVAGQAGMVGAALTRRLSREDCEVMNLARDEVDLRRQDAVESWISRERPQAIFLAAARVGGIAANAQAPAEFLFDNLMIATNIIHAAHRFGVEKLLFLGSSCIYPRLAPQPIPEDALLSGPLEPTSEAYAVAKIAGIKLCQAYRRQYGSDFISAMPTNLYGPGDNYDLERAHVLPALLRKAHEARQRGERRLRIWGSGLAKREFLHVDDCADALVFLMQHYSDGLPVNVGSGTELTIAELAKLIMRVVGLEGEIVTDLSRPDGAPRKLMDNTRLRNLGWTPSITLEEGIRRTYAEAPFIRAAA